MAVRSPVAPRSRKRKRGSIVELLIIVAVALGLALAIQALLVKPFRIPSKSMDPTLIVEQRVLVDRVSFRFSDPELGDIVVFHPPSGVERGPQCGVQHPSNQPCPEPTDEPADTNYIKRVVGLPGDELSVIDGQVYIDGEPLDEPYAQPCPSCDLRRTITVPPDHFFMMGDNRGQSADSRVWGPVPKDYLVGNAFFTYWPIPRIGTL